MGQACDYINNDTCALADEDPCGRHQLSCTPIGKNEEKFRLHRGRPGNGWRGTSSMRIQQACRHPEISTMRPKSGPNLFWYSAIFCMRSCTRVRSLTSPAS